MRINVHIANVPSAAYRQLPNGTRFQWLEDAGRPGRQWYIKQDDTYARKITPETEVTGRTKLVRMDAYDQNKQAVVFVTDGELVGRVITPPTRPVRRVGAAGRNW